jgi:hypothetical protein
MRKNCPYCNEETLGWRELILLNSFFPVQCANCHEWVLGSGWRTFLGIFTFIAILVATMVVWQYIPGEVEVLILPFALIAGAMAMALTAKPVKADAQQTDPSPFTPNPYNDKTILVRGWSEEELRGVLADFVDEELTAFAAFQIEIEIRSDNCFALTFPEDIHPAEFISLVNYLAYPINFSADERSIVVAGKTTLNSDFDGLPKTLVGTKALLYLPDDDKEHNVVFLQTESGVTLARTFSDGIWRRVNDTRLSSMVKSLAREPIATLSD